MNEFIVYSQETKYSTRKFDVNADHRNRTYEYRFDIPIFPFPARIAIVVHIVLEQMAQACARSAYTTCLMFGNWTRYSTLNMPLAGQKSKRTMDLLSPCLCVYSRTRAQQYIRVDQTNQRGCCTLVSPKFINQVLLSSISLRRPEYYYALLHEILHKVETVQNSIFQLWKNNTYVERS